MLVNFNSLVPPSSKKNLVKNLYYKNKNLVSEDLQQGFPKWAMTDTQGATSSKGGREGAMSSRTHRGAMRP